MIILLMGVTGVGKTTVGRALADSLQCKFADADDFHPPANIAKMHAGIPLDDADCGRGCKRCMMLSCCGLNAANARCWPARR